MVSDGETVWIVFVYRRPSCPVVRINQILGLAVMKREAVEGERNYSLTRIYKIKAFSIYRRLG